MTRLDDGATRLRSGLSVWQANDARLRDAHFTGLPEMVVNYFRFVAEDVRRHLARLGVRRLEDLIGRTAGNDNTFPFVTSNCAPWRGHSIRWPISLPWSSGPRSWLHMSSIA